MDFVKVPLCVAQRGARVYRPLMPYVRKFIAENRGKTVIEPEPLIGEDLEMIKGKLEAKSKAELVEIAKGVGIDKADKLTKEKLINKILGQE